MLLKDSYFKNNDISTFVLEGK